MKNPTLASSSRPTGGFSALELIIAVTIFAVLMSALGLTTMKASDAHQTGSARASLESRAHRVLDRIVEQFDEAGRGSLVPEPVTPLHTSSLSYQCATDFVDGAIVWGLEQRIEFRTEPGELDNGIDDDSDGLIDEGVIVWTEDPGEATQRETVWSSSVRELAAGELWNGLDDNGDGLVDEQGLSFDVQGDVMRVQVTLERLDGEGHTITATAQTSVRIRN